jgi:hypothetical protein
MSQMIHVTLRTQDHGPEPVPHVFMFGWSRCSGVVF